MKQSSLTVIKYPGAVAGHCINKGFFRLYRSNAHCDNKSIGIAKCFFDWPLTMQTIFLSGPERISIIYFDIIDYVVWPYFRIPLQEIVRALSFKNGTTLKLIKCSRELRSGVAFIRGHVKCFFFLVLQFNTCACTPFFCYFNFVFCWFGFM